MIVSSLQERIHINDIFEHELCQLRFQIERQNLQQIWYFLIRFQIRLSIIIFEMILELVNQFCADVKFQVQFFYLVHSIDVVGMLLRYFCELWWQTTQNVWKESDAEDDNTHSPYNFIAICRKDVSVADCGDGDGCPVEAVDVLDDDAGVLQLILCHPISVGHDISNGCREPEASADVQHKPQL